MIDEQADQQSVTPADKAVMVMIIVFVVGLGKRYRIFCDTVVQSFGLIGFDALRLVQVVSYRNFPSPHLAMTIIRL